LARRTAGDRKAKRRKSDQRRDDLCAGAVRCIERLCNKSSVIKKYVQIGY